MVLFIPNFKLYEKKAITIALIMPLKKTLRHELL